METVIFEGGCLMCADDVHVATDAAQNHDANLWVVYVNNAYCGFYVNNADRGQCVACGCPHTVEVDEEGEAWLAQ